MPLASDTGMADLPQVHDALEHTPVADAFRRYDVNGDRPLGPYAVLTATWLAGIMSWLGLSRTLRRPLPRMGAGDVALLGIATFRLSRLIAKDNVTSFARAPFTRFDSPGAPGETNEVPRKESAMQHAIGEWMSCPFCLSVWVSAAFMAGMTFFPRLTRTIAGLFAVVAVADGLQLGYGTAQKKAE